MSERVVFLLVTLLATAAVADDALPCIRTVLKAATLAEIPDSECDYSWLTDEVKNKLRLEELQLAVDTAFLPLNQDGNRDGFYSNLSADDAQMLQNIAHNVQKLQFADALLAEVGSSEFAQSANNQPQFSVVQQSLKSHILSTMATAIQDFITDKLHLPKDRSLFNFLNLSGQEDMCPKAPDCSQERHRKYRTYDGSCNNVFFTDWGMAGAELTRLLPAKYSNGVSAVRRSVVNNNPLPPARVLRTSILPVKDAPSDLNTLVVMQFGQIVAHDTSLTPDRTTTDEKFISCCTEDGQFTNSTNDACLPIELPDDDEFFSKLGRRCMSMVRAAVTTSPSCKLGPLQQLSAVSQLIDASFTYGSDKKTALSLRTNSGGLLLTQTSEDGREFLPNEDDPRAHCQLFPGENVCYRAGDSRVNQHPQVAVIQNMLLREHNRVARALMTLNPNWDDEKLYQEARRVVWAEWQHVVYEEYLPILLGTNYTTKHNITQSEGRSAYREDIHPGTINSFNTASYRSFHSLVQGDIKMLDEKRCPMGDFLLRDWFNDAAIVQEKDNYDGLLRGMTQQSSQALDNWFVTDIANFLFKSHSKPFGQDLESIDIQRGRDHGLAPYNQYRQLVGLKKAEGFDDFADSMSAESIAKLKQHYAHVDDVDLFVGGILELPFEGALTGKTFRDINGEQFMRWKAGDRFFYTHADGPYPLTDAQLGTVRNASLARLICDNSDNVTEVQPRPFYKVSESNPLTSCDEHPRVDLEVFQETRSASLTV